MGSPKKPQTLQLSSPDAANDSFSLPEKRSPISSRIWQEEKTGFTGEDLSMRNFCVSVHGDNDLTESFSFDTDSLLGAQRSDSVDVLSTLPVHETNKRERPVNYENVTADINKTHSNTFTEESIDVASGINKRIETIQKDITYVFDNQVKCNSEKATQESLLPSINLQCNVDPEITQKESSCESVLANSKVTKQTEETHLESLSRENYADSFGKSFSNLKEKLHVELEIAKDRIASHKPEIDKTEKHSKMEPSSDNSQVLSAGEPLTKEPLREEASPYSVEKASTYPCTKFEMDTSLDMRKNIGPIGQNVTEGVIANINVCETQSKITAKGQVNIKEQEEGDICTKVQSSQLITAKQDTLKQTETRVEYRSIAISPIIPPEGISSFTFQTGTSSVKNTIQEKTGRRETSSKEDQSKTYSSELTPHSQDVWTETRVRFTSVAVSPIIPPDGSSSFTFQSGHSSQALKDLQSTSLGQRTDTKCADNLPKTYSFELTPPNLDVGTETRVEYKSVAVSPIIPPDGSSFTFQTPKGPSVGKQEKQGVDLLPKTYSFELTPPNQDVGIQADTRAECVSVAVSPIIPPDGSSSFVFQSEQRLQNLTLRSSADNIAEKEPSTVKTQNQEVSTQAENRVQFISVAVSPIVPPDGSSSFTFLKENADQSLVANQKQDKDSKTIDNLPKTYSFELTPPDQAAGARTVVEYRSVAVSPIIPPGEHAFTFQNERNKEVASSANGSSLGNDGKNVGAADLLPKMYSFELTPPNQDIGIQAENKVECVSVAVSPFVFSPEPSSASSSFTFQTEQKYQESSSKRQEQTVKQFPCNISALPQACSLELTPHNQDVGTQADNRAQCISVAVSPIIPLEGSCSFIFHSEGAAHGLSNTVCPHMLEKPSMKDAELQVSLPVESRSVATDPMTPKGKSPKASYPEVRVKDTKGDPPEPVREVSWDEKGMTWEVYGASMEVEVLGMAIQKHLEKQIEEHGRQKVMTPQNTRGSSVRGAPLKGEAKRQQSVFRSFFHSVRRPRCCSRAGQTVE